MNPIDDALLAVMASGSGDTTRALHHLELARHSSQVAARRHRQLVEIAGLVVGGSYERAEGLSLLHAAEFPEDTELLARVTRRASAAP
jgi:hypothetical protein